MRTLSLLILIVSFISLSCKVIKPAIETSKSDETSIGYKPVDVPVKGAKVGTSLNMDSLYRAAVAMRALYIKDSINAALAGKPVPASTQQKKSITDPETKAQLTYWIDQYGKLQISCESKDQVVTMLVAEVTRLTKEVTKKTEIVKETPKWNWISMSALATVLLISIIINLLKFKIR